MKNNLDLWLPIQNEPTKPQGQPQGQLHVTIEFPPDFLKDAEILQVTGTRILLPI